MMKRNWNNKNNKRNDVVLSMVRAGSILQKNVISLEV